jgi:flagellar hook-length control protein FliK
MDTLNFIKAVPDEVRSKPSSISAKEPVIKRNKEHRVENTNEQERFSNKLKKEIKGTSNSQKNDIENSDSKSEGEVSGKKLPIDKEQSSKELSTKSESKNELKENLVEDNIAISGVVDLATEDLLTEDLDANNLTLDSLFQKIAISQDQSRAISEKGEKEISTAEIMQSIVEPLSTAVNPSTAEILKSIVDPISTLTNPSVPLVSDISQPVSANINNDTVKTLSSIFQGAMFQKEPTSNNFMSSLMEAATPSSISTSTGVMSSLMQGTTTGYDSSSNQQPQNPLMEQFSELQMKLLSHDKSIEESNFDISKLAGVVSNTSQATSTIDQTLLNPNKIISDVVVKTPVMDKQWSADFGQHIAYMAKSGGGNALIKLNPAHLGPVEASIKVSNEVATVQIVATNLTTRDALDAAIPKLKEMLEENGFSQVNVDISDKDSSHDNGNENKEASSANGELVDEEEGDFLDKDNIISRQSVIDGVVNYYA